jgi:membrane associated rhomboid family serine protease
VDALPSEARDQTFALRGRPREITLAEDGLHHPRASRGSGFAYTTYDDITHLATSPRAVWIGSRRSVYVLGRSVFADRNGPEHLVRALLERIAGRPGGADQLARMAQIEEVSRVPRVLRATWCLAIVCLAVFGLQILGGRNVEEVGYFNRVLVADGDYWRLVTANLLHAYPGFPLHLVTNLLGLFVLGNLAERSLGSARIAWVMGASGIAAMVASGLAGYPRVLGVSGVVAGLFGAVVWLELRRADRLPAWWRIPRRLLALVFLLSTLFDVLVPITAGAAHLGGFAAGVLATAVVAGGPTASSRPSPSWVRAGSTVVVLVTALASGQAAYELLRPGDYSARLTARLAGLPGISPEELNNIAWFIAIDPESNQEHLEAALLLAERAASETDRSLATVLDTLAELQFQLGQPEQALATIDEAIARDPASEYYREQRRRFLGERDPDDRPDSPLPWPLRPDGESPEAPKEDGIRV